MSDWGYLPQITTVEGSAAGSGKATITGSGSTNTKGSWSQIIASTTYPCSGMFLQIQCSTGSRAALIDIGIGGAGSEIVLIPNMYVHQNAPYQIATQAFIPIEIPAGTRVAARLQSNAASADFYVKAQFIEAQGIIPTNSATTYGAVTATSLGTALTSGSGAKGSWVQLSAACEDVRYAVVCVGKTPSSGADHWIDIGIGGSGSEVVIVPDLYCLEYSTLHVTPGLFSFPLAIPAGTRIAARSRSSTASQTINITLTGLA